MARPLNLSPKALKFIADCLFDGLTDSETALLAGVSQKFIERARAGEQCPEIKRATLHRKRHYIALIRDGDDRSNHWQRIAWFLERRYPREFSKPEVQLNLTTNASTTNNTLIITAEQAQNLQSRSNAIDLELSKLASPSARAARAASIDQESAPASAASSSACAAGKESEGHHSPARTPAAPAQPPDPNLSGKSETGEISSNSKPDPSLAGNCQPSDYSRNSKKSGRHMTVADGRKRRDDVGRRASRRDEAKSGGAAASAGVRKRGKYGVRMKKKAGG
jgi:hypothetical protein